MKLNNFCAFVRQKNHWNAHLHLRFFQSILQQRCFRYWSSNNLSNFSTRLRKTWDKMVLYYKHSPPQAKPIPGVQMQVHNQIFQDEFSWLQDLNNGKVKEILKEENRFTAQMMSNTTSFQEVVFENIEELSKQIEEPSLPVSLGNYIYYTKESDNYPNLLIHCRKRNGSCEEVIFDESSVDGLWKYIGVKCMKVAPSEKFVAFVLDTSGDDAYQGILIDMSKNPGKILQQLPSVNLEWAIADKVLYYTTFDHLKRANKVWRHVVGKDPSVDKLIFEEIDSRFYVDVSCTKDQQFITINSNSKSTSEVHILDATDANALPRLIRRRETGIEYYVENHNDTFYILTNLPDGKNYKVMTTKREKLSSGDWTTLVPSSNEEILEDMDIFSGHCVLYQTKNMLPQLSVIPMQKPSNKYTMEFSDSTCVLNPGYNLDFYSSVVKFSISSPIQPPTLMELDLATKEMKHLSDTSREKQNGLYFSRYSRSEIKATSKDGTEVPITIFHKKDIELNGQHPILVHVYGSYGMNVNMEFSPEKFYLLSQDWILAFCHVRGGGELGRRWYHMGRLKNKNKSFEDFEACVRTLQKQRYSSPHLTAVKGTSAGGLPVAVLCNNAPHLVKAAVLKVPLVDVMSAMLDQELPLTAQEFEEFGNPRLDVDVFNCLKSFCPYINIKNQDHPNMLFMSSINDTRVPYWMPLKFVTKLRHIKATCGRSTSQNLLLLKTDFESGHYGAGTLEEFLYSLISQKDDSALARQEKETTPEIVASLQECFNYSWMMMRLLPH